MQAEWHRRHRQLLRVLVIDLDVHQGNGTAAIFRDDPTVFTLSLHGAKNFPARKEASDLDVELPDGCGDDAYLAALHEALAQAWHLQAATPPGLAFYVAGADPHEGDRLGRLKLSFAGLAERDRLVFAALARAPHAGRGDDGRRLRPRHRGHRRGAPSHAAGGAATVGRSGATRRLARRVEQCAPPSTTAADRRP